MKACCVSLKTIYTYFMSNHVKQDLDLLKNVLRSNKFMISVIVVYLRLVKQFYGIFLSFAWRFCYLEKQECFQIRFKGPSIEIFMFMNIQYCIECFSSFQAYYFILDKTNTKWFRYDYCSPLYGVVWYVDYKKCWWPQSDTSIRNIKSYNLITSFTILYFLDLFRK